MKMACNNILPAVQNNDTLNVNIVSFNMHGYNQGMLTVQSMCNDPKINAILIQEHWMISDKLNNFNKLSTDFEFYGISAMDNILKRDILRGRPFGGVGTLIRKSWCQQFNKVSCIVCAERYVIVALDELILINVYLPSANNVSERDELCSVLVSLSHDLEALNLSYAVLGGDVNCDVSCNSSNAKIINDAFSNMGLQNCMLGLKEPVSFKFTFCAPSRNAFSHIDHFFIGPCLTGQINSLNVVYDISNFSDHLPLILNVKSSALPRVGSITDASSRTDSSTKPPRLMFNWNEGNNTAYYELTRIELKELHILFSLTLLMNLKC